MLSETREGWTCLDSETFALHTSKSTADETTGDVKVVGLVAEAGIQMPKHCLHHLRSHSVERNLRTNGRWKLSSLEQPGARLVVSSQLLHPEKLLQLDPLPTHLHRLHKLFPDLANRL